MTDKDRAPQWGDAPASVTEQEWLATAISALLIGCLLGWALFGKPQQALEICKSADLPDWLAAAGTWIIGVGAFWYARSGHLHRLEETYRTEYDIAERKQGRYLALIGAAVKMRFIKNMYDSFGGMPKSNKDLRQMAAEIVPIIADMEWGPEDLGLLSGDAMIAYRYYETDTRAIRRFANLILQEVPEDQEPLAGDAQQLAELLEKYVEESSISGGKVMDALREARDSVRMPTRPAHMQDHNA